MGEQPKSDVKKAETTADDHAATVEEGYEATTPPESQGDGDPAPRTATPDEPKKPDD
ncbi:MAG TPA: hypothetical protein VK928_06115 [Longimicrobiales bacterium]|nr:hypothetical protein [Longimicrobiales bacterium]